MKNTIKLFGIIAIIAVIGFSMVSCKEYEPDGGEEISGTTKANSEGKIDFFYTSLGTSASDCVFTTDIPGHESFTVVSRDAYPHGEYIYGLTPNKEVNWTAKINDGKLKINPNGTFDGQVSLEGRR